MIEIGRDVIGEGQLPYVIANIGNNWSTIEDCKRAIDSAKTSGASAVKFSLYSFSSLYGVDIASAPKWYRQNSELPIEWVTKLKNQADSLGIELLLECFDAATMKSIDHLVKAHCIAASDLNYFEILECAAGYRKPVFLQCGAATESAVILALSALKNIPTILMYSVEAYPARAVNLFMIDQLAKLGKYIGYTDNTIDTTYIPIAAVRNHKAMVLEKHFNTLGPDTQDADFSVGPLAFAAMVDSLAGKRQSCLIPMESERDMLLKNRRRLVAVKDIQKGQRLIYGNNYGAFRSLKPGTDSFPPYMVKELSERGTAAKGIAIGEMLGPDNVEL